MEGKTGMREQQCVGPKTEYLYLYICLSTGRIVLCCTLPSGAPYKRGPTHLRGANKVHCLGSIKGGVSEPYWDQNVEL